MSWKKFLLAQVLICFLSLIFLGKVRAESNLWKYVAFKSVPSPAGTLTYITFVDQNTIAGGISCGPQMNCGYIYLSTDGGQTWSQKVKNVANITKIKFLNSQVGFAVGGFLDCFYGLCRVGMYLGKTIDGGNTWTNLTENFRNSLNYITPLYELWIVDPNTIYVISKDRVYVSRDGGDSWRSGDYINISLPPLNGYLQFVTSSVGFVSFTI